MKNSTQQTSIDSKTCCRCKTAIVPGADYVRVHLNRNIKQDYYVTCFHQMRDEMTKHDVINFYEDNPNAVRYNKAEKGQNNGII